MSDVAGELKVVISAEDNASAVIAGVSSSVSSLGSANGALIGQSAAVNAAMNGNARSASAMGAAVTQTKNNLKQLETGLAGQKEKTKQYTRALRESSTVLRDKQTAVRAAATSYKANTSAINQNIAGLKEQQSSISATIDKRNGEIVKLKEANKTIEKSSQAYKDNQKAIKWTETELRGLQQQHRETSYAIMEQERALKSEEATYRSAQSEVKAAARAREEARNSMKQSQAAKKEYSDSITKTSESLQKQQAEYEKIQKIENSVKLGKGMKEFAEGVDAVAKPLYVVSAATAAAGGAAVKLAVDFEDNFAAVKKTVDGTPEQMEAIKQSIIDMTTVGINGHQAIPQTTAELTELAAAGGQLGISTEGITDFTETMAMLGTATNLVGEQGAATIARFQNVMQIPESEIRNVGSAIVDLGNHSATTEAEIAAMALRMGKYGQTVGMSAADVLGYSAALSSMGIEAQLGGSAVGRTWLSIETAVAKGGKELQAFAKYSGKSAKEFKEQWNTDSKGAFNGLLKGLKEADNLTLALDDIGINNTQDITAMQALVNGFDLVTESVDRANKAYEENTALQAEFDAKAETTASKIQVAKNNATEAARSFGEVLLPSIVDITGSLSGASQGLAKMDDGTKKLIVNAGLTTVALGATTKAVTGSIKTVGSAIEGVGKIRGLFAAGGALAEAAPTMSAIAAAAGPVAIGIGAISAAALIAKAGYDAWYDSQYRWSEGLSEGNEKIAESLNKYKQLSSLQNEIKELKLVIENPDSSAEQVETAKTRIEEIKDLLSEEYNLIINSDNSNLDDAIEKVKQFSENELQTNINNQRIRLSNLVGKDDNYGERRQKLVRELEEEQSLLTRVGKAQLKLSDAQVEVAHGAITQTEALQKAKEAYKEAYGRDYTETSGLTELENFQKIFNNLAASADVASKKIGSKDEGTGLWGKLNDLDSSHEELKNVSSELANWETELVKIKSAAEDSDGVQRALSEMGEFIKIGQLDMYGYAQAAAVAMSGVDSLSDAWEQAANGDSTALDSLINGYIQALTTFGASTDVAVQGASLLANGITDVSQVTENNLPSVLKSLKELGAAQGLDMTATKLTILAQTMGIIPEEKHIEITADGDIEIVDGTLEKLKEITTENVHVSVNADGDITILNQADGSVKNLHQDGAVSLVVNADGNIDVLDEAGNKLAEIKNDPSATVTVNEELGDTVDKVPDAVGKANFELGESPTEVPDATGKANFELGTYPTSIPPITATVNVKYEKQATGTQNFTGGLAMVNDQRGVSDPRELIVDKGRAFIPEGRDVILPLSKGAKVYTAAQTKALMSGLGIPHYAQGKDNSEGFTAARDDWQHYTRTHAVTSAQELEKWLELQKQFKDNEKDIADIDEQIFSTRQKITSEQNKASESYVIDRSALNDWEEYGDSAIAAFGRIRERNFAEVQAQRMTWEDFTDTMSGIGSNMFSEYISYSEKKLAHDEKYNNLSAQSYLDKLDEMRKATEEYYANDIINAREHAEALMKFDEMYIDKQQEENDRIFSAWERDADAWYDMRSTYDDWEDFGDSEEAFYKRKIERVKQFFKEETIGFEKFVDDTNRYEMDLYKSQKQRIEDALGDMQQHISDMRTQFSEQEQALRESWTVADRKTDMSEVQAQLDIYKGAVTERGQQKYKELQEQMKQLKRDEELYNLQVSNNATLEALEDEYKIAEDNKKVILKGMRAEVVDVQEAVNSLIASVENPSSSSPFVSLLERIETAIYSIETGNITNYHDNRRITQQVSSRPSSSVGAIALPYLVGF